MCRIKYLKIYILLLQNSHMFIKLLSHWLTQTFMFWKFVGNIFLTFWIVIKFSFTLAESKENWAENHVQFFTIMIWFRLNDLIFPMLVKEDQIVHMYSQVGWTRGEKSLWMTLFQKIQNDWSEGENFEVVVSPSFVGYGSLEKYGQVWWLANIRWLFWSKKEIFIRNFIIGSHSLKEITLGVVRRFCHW